MGETPGVVFQTKEHKQKWEKKKKGGMWAGKEKPGGRTGCRPEPRRRDSTLAGSHDTFS